MPDNIDDPGDSAGIDVLTPSGPNGPGENEMSGDISEDCLELLLDEEMGALDEAMVELVGNFQSSDNILRHSSVRKFNQDDPIEAAAVEKILG